MRVAINVLNGKPCRVFGRWGPSTNPYYSDVMVDYGPTRGAKVVRNRHLRKPMPGEVRNFTATYGYGAVHVGQ